MKSLSPGGQLWLHIYRTLQLLQDCSLWLLREKISFSIVTTILEHLNPKKMLGPVEEAKPML